MTIHNVQQCFSSYQIDNLENEQFDIQNINDATVDSIHKFQNKLLNDETCRLLFGDSTNLLDDILSHPLSIDYFNVYLSLPIFGQRVFCHRITHQFDFDPPLLTKHQTCKQLYEAAKEWLIKYRLNNYIHTDIYIESLLGLLLTKADDILESSSKLHTFIGSKQTVVEEQSYIFSTVIDVRQFYQFLQSTSGIKYWNFFIDSMRLLQSRHTSRFNRIDISYLNFIYKYYSHQHEFHSITTDLNNSRMPDSNTSDTIWFQMAINAMHQLRIYWLPRYLNQLSSPSRSKLKHSTIKSKPIHIDNPIKSSLENIIVTSSNHHSNNNSIIKESKLVKFTLGNISYLDYNPQQYILIQPSKQHDFQQDIEELNESNNNNNQTDTNCKIRFEITSFPSSDRSIEDYATDANIELFYRILVSDLLAGLPFFEYISQVIPKIDAIPRQTCIRFIIDAEILLSIPSGKFKERILREFISRYLEVTATEKLPNEIFDNIEEQRIELIQELITKDNNQYSLLWKILLKITKFLIPDFLNYIKFDRLHFLIQGKTLNTNLIFDDLRHLLPSVNFETLLINQQNTKETDLKQANFNETEILSRTNLINCGEQPNDLLKSLFKNQYNTTEKLINTDEQCEFRTGERFRPLIDDELEQELRQSCTKSDIETILVKPFDAPDNKTFIDDSLSHSKIKQTLTSNEYPKFKSIEAFTLEIMNSAREIFEIDRFISTLMDESLNLVQTNRSLESAKDDHSSSSLELLFDEILLPDSSSSTTFPKLITTDTNNNALVSSNSEINSSNKEDIILQKPIETKILSLIGSYFINSPNIIKNNKLENTLMNNSLDPIIKTYLKENDLKSINKFSLHQQFDSLLPSFHGLIKELSIDNIGIGHLHIDLTKTNISFNDQNILKLNNKLKLYTNNHLEFLLADIKSYTFDSNKKELHLYFNHFKLPKITKSDKSLTMNVKSIYEKDNFYHESIKYAPKDKSNEIKNTVIKKRISYFQNDNQQQLLKFIQNQINNHQWPLQQYIGIKGQRAWRALKLAADISNLDNSFMLNYHNDLDWISTNDNFGSFGERTYLIIRNFERRIEQEKLSINKDSCSNNH